MAFYYFDASALVKYYVTAQAEALLIDNPFSHISPDDTSA
jgi:hypothetical protein